MNIPEQFELFSQVWQIRAGSPKELDDNNGLCYTDSCEILLNPQQTAQGLKQTLLHELVHCIESKMNLDLTENQVDSLAIGLNHLFTANPVFTLMFAEPQLTTEEEDNE
jgi:hypothetical protein